MQALKGLALAAVSTPQQKQDVQPTVDCCLLLVSLLHTLKPAPTLQRSDGRFLIGETQPSEASNTDTSSKNAARILQLAADAVPALSAAKVQGMFVGYRPYPADGYPVLGWLPSCRNAYVAGGRPELSWALPGIMRVYCCLQLR